MKPMTLLSLLFVLAPVVMTLTCGPSSTGPDGPRFPITLSLESSGRDTATFRGEPVTVLVECDDPTRIDELGWTMGNAQFFRDPYLDYGATLQTSISVRLRWLRIPGHRDTLGRAYDSIFVTTGGGIRQSNTVRVYVVNIPPEIVSLTVDDSVYERVADTLEADLDTAGPIELSVTTRDNDDLADLTIDWSTPLYPERLATMTGSTIQYIAPVGSFSDTLYLHVYDRDGGEVRLKIHLFNTGVYTRPVIDAVTAGSSVLTVSSDSLPIQVYPSDTLKLAATAHDPEAGDSLRYVWTIVSASSAGTLTWAGPAASYAFPLDLLYADSTAYRDTVKLTAIDDHGITDNVWLPIVVGNHSPVFDSIEVSGDVDTVLKGASLLWTLQTLPGAAITMKGFAKDLDAAYGDFLTYEWTSGGDTTLSRTYSFTGPQKSESVTMTFKAIDVKNAAAIRRVTVLVEETAP